MKFLRGIVSKKAADKSQQSRFFFSFGFNLCLFLFFLANSNISRVKAGGRRLQQAAGGDDEDSEELKSFDTQCCLQPGCRPRLYLQEGAGYRGSCRLPGCLPGCCARARARPGPRCLRFNASGAHD